MTASEFCLTNLPVELLEKIFGYLPGQDIIRIEAVWSMGAIHDIPTG
jgi:hypothetical protein